ARNDELDCLGAQTVFIGRTEVAKPQQHKHPLYSPSIIEMSYSGQHTEGAWARLTRPYGKEATPIFLADLTQGGPCENGASPPNKWALNQV
ncbi:hypothetical protein PSTT_09012, partial [Puccinia striiformis]